MVSGSIVERTFFMGVPAITKIDVTPVSAMACVFANDSTLGTSCHRAEAMFLVHEVFDVITVYSSFIGVLSISQDITVTFMIIYLLRPTPSEGRKMRLVLCLGASIVPRIDVLLGVTSIICLLMVCTPTSLGTCTGCVAVLHIEATQKTQVHVAVSFDNVGVHWGHVSCSHADSRNSKEKSWHDARSYPTLARQIVCE